MGAAMLSAVFRALWHKRDGSEVSPTDQLALWSEGVATDAAIVADLVRIAHTSTSGCHRLDGAVTPWLRITGGNVALDLLEWRPMPEPMGCRTLAQGEVVSAIRQLMAAADLPRLLGHGVPARAPVVAVPCPPALAPRQPSLF